MNSSRECKSASESARRRSQRYGVMIVLGCLLCLLLMCLLMPFYGRQDPGASISAQKANMLSIGSAMWQFEVHFRSFPSGDNAAIARQLLGSNPHGLVLLNSVNTNRAGELVDYWNTPYNIEVKSNQMIVHSAGPNKKFRDADDLVFDIGTRKFSKL